MNRVLLINHFTNGKPIHNLLFIYCSLMSSHSSKQPIPVIPIPKTLPKSKSKSQSPPNPPLKSSQFHRILSQIPPRFTSEDIFKTLVRQKDPQICLQIFNWASQQPRFKHDHSTYLLTVKKLGSAKMYTEMDYVVNQVLAIPSIWSETLFNTMIYFYTEERKLSRAVNIFKLMQKTKNPHCVPSVRTYNLLFAAFLSRGTNSYINHMYMETTRCLFRQMVNEGIEPDVFSLNSMIKGYVLSLHLNDALRIFHQMGVVYNPVPNSYSYDYLIHGLCAQGRSKNAMELYGEMKEKGFVPSCKAYNSLVNCLAIGGEFEEALRVMWEMSERRRLVEFITYRTVLDELCRRGRGEDAMGLLRELKEKDFFDGHTHRKLLLVLEDDYGDMK